MGSHFEAASIQVIGGMAGGMAGSWIIQGIHPLVVWISVPVLIIVVSLLRWGLIEQEMVLRRLGMSIEEEDPELVEEYIRRKPDWEEGGAS